MLLVVAIELDWPFLNQWEPAASLAKLGKRSALTDPSVASSDDSGSSSKTRMTTGVAASTETDVSTAASGCQTSSEASENPRNSTGAATATRARMRSQVRAHPTRASSQTIPPATRIASTTVTLLPGITWCITAEAATKPVTASRAE